MNQSETYNRSWLWIRHSCKARQLERSQGVQRITGAGFMVAQEESHGCTGKISRKSFDTKGFQDLHEVWNTESSESVNNQLVTPQFSVEA